MANIDVSGPDGSTFSFPEGTSQDTIKSALKKHYSKGDTDSLYQKIESGLSSAAKAIDPFEYAKSFGERGSAVAQGLVSSTLGLPGFVEKLAGVTVPGLFGQKPQKMPVTGSETFFPTPEQISKFIETPATKELPGYVTAGEFLPIGAGASKLVKSGVEAAAPTIKKAFEKSYRAVKGLGEEEARQALEKEVLAETKAAQAGAAPSVQTQAETALKTAQAATQAAERGANAIEAQLAQMPTMSPEQFVKITRDTATKLEKSLIDARESGSGYQAAIDNAGPELKVETSHIIDKINELQNKLRNPQFNSISEQLKKLLTNQVEAGAEPIESLSIGQADSLRKTIDNALRTRVFGETAFDKEIAANLKPIRKLLVEEATGSDKGYREALGKFNTLSRPLDIFSEGELGKITAKADRTAGGYAAREAEVIGTLLNRGGDSARMIERLQQANPEIRNAVKLYFSRKLFGEGATPTVNQMRSFLLSNETVLKRLNLYQDFADIRNSIKTAKDAIKSATQMEEAAKVGVVGAGKAAELAKEARQAELQILNAPRKQAARVTRNYINQLFENERITDARYKELLNKVDALEKSAESEAKIRRGLLVAAGLVGAGYLKGATKIVPPIFGGQ